jgi:hypothetical protein
MTRIVPMVSVTVVEDPDGYRVVLQNAGWDG